MLHGGEPLLAGHDRLRRIITELHQVLAGICQLDLRIHTNGVQLSEEFCELFAEHRVKVGISLDGDQAGQRPASPVCQWAEQLRQGDPGH